jgi:hypothetical protein
MSFKHKPKKLDKRYNGGHLFKYIVDVGRSVVSESVFYAGQSRILRRKEFVDIQHWAWQTWGPSCDLTSYAMLEKEYLWSWDQEHNNLRIFLKSDKELAWFQLRWG